MKRSLLLLLLSLLLVFSLTACGKEDKTANDPSGSQNAVTENGGTGSAAQTAPDTGNSGQSGSGGTLMEDAGDMLEDAGQDARDLMDDVGSALTDGADGEGSAENRSVRR